MRDFAFMAVIAERLIDSGLPAASHTDAGALPQLVAERLSGAEWDALIADFDEVCQEQMYAFAAARWPGVEHEPVAFRLEGEIVGGTLMMVQNLPFGIGRIAVSKWAPMLKDGHRPDAGAIRAAMVEMLIADFADRRRQMLSILPHAALTQLNPAYDWLIARGFRRGSELLFPSRYIVNLRLSDEQQRRSFSQNWRRQLNKAEKMGLAFEHGAPERLAEFDALYAAMTDRKQFPDHSAYDTVPALFETPVEALRPELFFVRHDGEVVAGAVIFKAGERAVYLYGATNDRALPLRAGYFMHWHIIRWLRDHTRANWYDLGGTDGFQGLHQFKKGMVGDAGVIRPVPPVANYASRPLAYLTGAGAFAARDAYYHVRRLIEGWRNPKARGDQTRTAEEDGR
jgi:hypothetical protein